MSWLCVLNENFRLQPESFVLAVHIFDKFLLTTKVNYITYTILCTLETMFCEEHFRGGYDMEDKIAIFSRRLARFVRLSNIPPPPQF